MYYSIKHIKSFKHDQASNSVISVNSFPRIAIDKVKIAMV